MIHFTTKETRTYTWQSIEDDAVCEDHFLELAEAATEHIAEMIAKGFVCGELFHTCSDGIDYVGHWDCSVTREDG